MSPITDRSFGILIAYLIPGFLVVWLFGRKSAVLSQWLAVNRETAPTVGGFLYVTLASIGLGLVLSTIRWAVLDQIHHHTGIRRPGWDFARLQENIDAYRTAVDYHYRYYQFYGNSLVALIVLGAGGAVGFVNSTGVVFATLAILAVLFFVASRDALSKYYGRAGALATSGSKSWDKVRFDRPRP